ncbi:MAG: UDP-4-amino-4,6-dideoxy-N-acetyl-beta-L-altrosamine N-acetyltransferase [Rhodobacteraceae bacterium]|nr:MAG: UDP-4-amino-4,6-dideoxy-N-acetyl-beta-L-altrosamine N-acetyltransferase [Paracoccaceae bacterium]
MTKDDLGTVLAWRNHPSIRNVMYTTDEISMGEHQEWFKNREGDNKTRLLIFEVNEEPQGFINFRDVGRGGIVEWGFYLAPDAPRDNRRLFGRVTLKYAFANLGAHKVCGQALVSNTRSTRFHKILGFVSEGMFREQHFDGEKYHDVEYYGLLQSEWRAKMADEKGPA